jgi:hypothetical protein
MPDNITSKSDRLKKTILELCNHLEEANEIILDECGDEGDYEVVAEVIKEARELASE